MLFAASAERIQDAGVTTADRREVSHFAEVDVLSAADSALNGLIDSFLISLEQQRVADQEEVELVTELAQQAQLAQQQALATTEFSNATVLDKPVETVRAESLAEIRDTLHIIPSPYREQFVQAVEQHLVTYEQIDETAAPNEDVAFADDSSIGGENDPVIGTITFAASLPSFSFDQNPQAEATPMDAPQPPGFVWEEATYTMTLRDGGSSTPEEQQGPLVENPPLEDQYFAAANLSSAEYSLSATRDNLTWLDQHHAELQAA